MRYLFTFCWCLFLPALIAQSYFQDLLSRYHQRQLPEKVFLHTDKNIYAAGETIWVAIYLVDGQTHWADTISNVIHLELRDRTGEVILHQQVDPHAGHASSDLELPATLAPGDYQLAGYTNFQRNSGVQSIFHKTIRIISGLPESGGVEEGDRLLAQEVINPESEVRLRFFPEGGDCVLGIACRVAVTAEGVDGSLRSGAVELLDAEGRRLKTIDVAENGVGTIRYLPRGGESMRWVGNSPTSNFTLPKPLQEGVSVAITTVQDTTRLTIQTNASTGLTGKSLLVHVRGISLLEQQFSSSAKRAVLLFPPEALPAGVVVATVFNTRKEPVAERLFFVPPGPTDLALSLSDSVYETRSAVSLSLDMNQEGALFDTLTGGRISLSVLPLASTGGPREDDIRSWLLLNSDLDRPIRNASNLLFATDVAQRTRKIQDYLLTRGWRRFRWADLHTAKPAVPAFPLEKGIYLRGRMGKMNQPATARPGKIFLTRYQSAFVETTVTDAEGNFVFGPYLITGEVPVIIQGRYKGGVNNREKYAEATLSDNYIVHLETTPFIGPDIPALAKKIAAPAANIPDAESELDYTEVSRRALTVARTYDSLVADLDVIDVVTKRVDAVKEDRRERTGIYRGAEVRLVMDSIPGALGYRSLLDFVRQVPGVIVSGSERGTSVLIRGVSSINASVTPLFLLDGVQVDLQTLIRVPLPMVEFIDVMKGASTSMLGIQGANGAILVYTRRNGTTVSDKKHGLLNVSLKGYHKVRQFAVFDVDRSANRGRPDLRTTLHWEPELRVDDAGRGSTTFTTSHQKVIFQIIAQGLRRDGRPFFGMTRFRVR